MKLLTYNIWEDNKDFSKRKELLIKEINSLDIDYIAFQEVKKLTHLNYIIENTDFKYGYFYEGLGFISKHKLKQTKTFNEDNNFIQRLTYENIAFTNLHLDWRDESKRRKGLSTVIDFIEEDPQVYEFILGDFNSSPESTIHFELLMDDFTDIHKSYCHQTNDVPLPTLDFDTNPRWRGKEDKKEPLRVDWVLLNTEEKFTINNAQIIGTNQTNGKTPSDHYGVLVDLTLK